MAPSGFKRYSPPKRKHEERFSVLHMGWWFDDKKIHTKEVVSKLIDYFETCLPEALPKRYGEYEPPQNKLIDTGKEHLKAYLLEHRDNNISWYPAKPVVAVNLHIWSDWGFIQGRGHKIFRSNSLSIEFDSAVLDQPGWKKHLQKVFKDISLIISPFYGEVRTLHNKIHGGSTYFVDNKSEESPIQGSRWMGVPKDLGKAVLVGDPYLSNWPMFKNKGTKLGSFYFASTNDWKSDQNVSKVVGSVPSTIAQVQPYKVFLTFEESLKKKQYKLPPIFPFEEG